MQTCTHTHIYLEGQWYPKQRTTADYKVKPVNRLYIPKITVFEGTQLRNTTYIYKTI